MAWRQAAKRLTERRNSMDDYNTLRRQFDEIVAKQAKPVDLILYCPNCGMQHIDAPDLETPNWTNPPHRSHLCRISDGGCGCVWRPGDVSTNGVSVLKTQGKADTWPAEHNEEVRAASGVSATDGKTIPEKDADGGVHG
jgi:hypothetical protein